MTVLTFSALFCTVSGSDFVVFISLLTLSWAKFRPGPSIFVHSHTIFELPHLCLVYTLCSKSRYCDHVQRTMSYYGPYPGPVWQLGVEYRVTLATVGCCCQAVFWTSDLYQGLRDRLRKPRVTPNIKKADGGHMSLKLGDTIIETDTGKVVKEEGRVELLPLWAGCPVPSFISALPFVCILIEVPRMWTLALHNIVAQFVLNGILVAVTGETADVRACVSNLKAACAEEFFHADVCVYNVSKPSALYSMGQTALALCSLHQFSACLPRYLSYVQGPLTTAIPVEVFCYLLYALDLIQQNSTWVMDCTQQEEKATQPEEEDGESQKRPPPPKGNRQAGGRHPRQG